MEAETNPSRPGICRGFLLLHMSSHSDIMIRRCDPENETMSKSASDILKNYMEGVSGAADKWERGINSTDADPTELAIAAKDKMTSKFNQAVDSGLWEQKLREAGKKKWKEGAVAKKANYASGTRAAKSRVEAHLTKWAPLYAQVKAEAAKMPSNTFEEAMAKSAFVARRMKELAGKPV